MRHTELPQDSAEQKMAVKNCILFQRCGSVAYGTNIPGKSDDDYMGVFVPEEDYCGIGLKGIEQVEFRTNPTDSGHRNTPQDMDCTLYSVKKFIQLLLNNNPNSLESLFYPENCRLYVNHFGQMILDAKDVFVSKKAYHSFKGYSFSQIARLERGETKTTGRVDLIEKFGYDVKMASHSIRLYLECNELLSTGGITLPLKENNLVLSIKRGEWSKIDFLAEAKRLETICDSLYASTKIAHSPNHDAAHELLKKINKDFLGYGKTSRYGTVREWLAGFLRHTADFVEK